MTSLLPRPPVESPSLAPPASDLINVARIDSTNWRVTVSSPGDGGVAHLLGFVEQLRLDRFEVLWLDEPLAWAYEASFDTALAALANRAGYAGVVHLRRAPLPVPVREPVRHRLFRRS